MNEDIIKSYYRIVEEEFLVIHFDKNGNVIYANEKFLQSGGYSLIFLEGEKDNPFKNILKQTASEKVWKGKISFQKQNGTPWKLDCFIAPIEETADIVFKYAAFCFEEGRPIAYSDKNEIFIKEDLVREIGVNIAEKTKFSFVLCEVDGYDSLADKEGIIKKLAAKIKEALRESDVVGKWSEKSFGFVCVNINIGQAALVAERIRDSIERDNNSGLGGVTCSFGSAHYDGEATKEELLSSVIERLDSSKKSGGNRVCI